jgi:hypothetical protein
MVLLVLSYAGIAAAAPQPWRESIRQQIRGQAGVTGMWRGPDTRIHIDRSMRALATPEQAAARGNPSLAQPIWRRVVLSEMTVAHGQRRLVPYATGDMKTEPFPTIPRQPGEMVEFAYRPQDHGIWGRP